MREIAIKKLRDLMVSAGMTLKKVDEINFADFQGYIVTAELTIEKNEEYGDKNKVWTYKKKENATLKSAASGDVPAGLFDAPVSSKEGDYLPYE